MVAVLGGRGGGLGDGPNSPFTSLLLAVSSPPAPCLPTSTRGSFLSLSPSIRTRTTPDLSTISWMTLPLLPMTLPAQKERRQPGAKKEEEKRVQTLEQQEKRAWLKKRKDEDGGGQKSGEKSRLTHEVPGYLKILLPELQVLSGLPHRLRALQHDRRLNQRLGPALGGRGAGGTSP